MCALCISAFWKEGACLLLQSLCLKTPGYNNVLPGWLQAVMEWHSRLGVPANARHIGVVESQNHLGITESHKIPQHVLQAD